MDNEQELIMEEKSLDQQIRDYQKQSEEKFQDTIKVLTDKIPTIIAVGIMIWWLFYGTISVEPSELEIKSRIALSLATVVLSACYCNLLAEGGFKSGKSTKTFREANTEWASVSKEALPKRKQISKFAVDLAKSNLKQIRKNSLESVGLNYNEVFDSDGKLLKPHYYKDKSYLSSQKKVIKKCSKLKVYVPNMFCSINGTMFGVSKPETEKEFRAKTYTIKTLIRAVLSIVSVGIIFKYNEISLGGIIYSLFQIVLWSISGWNQRVKNFTFVTETLVDQIKDKTNIIESYNRLSDEEKLKYEENSATQKEA